tara:strand:- start:195 stop:608 length:414 start_codon:yes stop_codon:yes gene_type:complete
MRTGLLSRIKEAEGWSSTVYDDHLGIPTIGWGFAIKDLDLDKDVAEIILTRKLIDTIDKIGAKFAWFKAIHVDAKDVVIEMCYQMGVTGFSKFKKTISYLEKEEYEKASVEMLDSQWGKTQTPKRAKNLANIIKNIK